MKLNAFSKSQNISPTVNLLLSAGNISFISLKEAFSVELFLKPYCLVANILFWLMCWYSLWYIGVTFSRIFEKDVSKEIGLKLVISVLSFLISENFNQEGKIPDESDLLHMFVGGDVLKDVLTFRIFIGIASYPWAFLDFSELIIFSISLGVEYFSFMLEQGSLKFL